MTFHYTKLHFSPLWVSLGFKWIWTFLPWSNMTFHYTKMHFSSLWVSLNFEWIWTFLLWWN
jgi:hypothetical protein